MNPITLLVELSDVESKLGPGSALSELDLLTLATRRNQIIELLIAFKVTTGFYNQRLEDILLISPEARQLLELYQSHNNGNLDRADSPAPGDSRLAKLTRRLPSVYGQASGGELPEIIEKSN